MKKTLLTAYDLRLTVVVIVVLASSPVANAQQKPPAQTAANSMTQAIKDSWNEAKRNVRASADVMPEAKFNFKPVDTVRTFGAILAHVAGAAYEFCSAAKPEKTPHTEDEFEKSAKTRADIVKALDGAIAYCDAVVNSLDDKKAAEVINGAFGGPKAARAAAVMGNTGHFMEHYGNLVTYMRMNGLVPPSSQQ